MILRRIFLCISFLLFSVNLFSQYNNDFLHGYITNDLVENSHFKKVAIHNSFYTEKFGEYEESERHL